MRVGVIDCGDAGRSHVRGYIENGASARDLYLCDVDGSRAVEAAREFGVSAENVFHGDECHLDLVGRVDVVSIATPPLLSTGTADPDGVLRSRSHSHSQSPTGRYSDRHPTDWPRQRTCFQLSEGP